MPPAALQQVADALRDALARNCNTRVTVQWKASNQANAAMITWHGTVALREGELLVRYDEKDDELFAIPNPAAVYYQVDIHELPGKAASFDDPAPPVAPVLPLELHNVKTWAPTLREANGIALLELQIAQKFGITDDSSLRLRTNHATIVQFMRTCVEVADWDDAPNMVALGNMIYQQLRDAKAYEDRVPLDKLHAQLYPDQHPGDAYGAQLAKIKEEQRKKKEKEKGKRAQFCTTCQKAGHVAANCRDQAALNRRGGPVQK
jgi:hypothetical protein